MPDGQSLIFSSERDSRSDLYRLWLKDRRIDRLTHHFVGRAIMPSVSADGKFVAFAAQTLQRLQFWEFQIHVLDLATGKTRALDNSGGACWPSWSPDGRLANVLLAKEPSTIQIRNADGSAPREVAADAETLALLPRLVEGREVDRPLGQPAASRRRRLGPRDRSRRRLASAAETDDGPGQRPLAGLETVAGRGHDPFSDAAGTRYNLCDVEPGARRSSCHLLVSGCSQNQAVQAIDKLKPCTGYDTPVDAYCGTLKVYENRETKQGRQIDLNIVVLPALRADAQPDPLFFLAGGPGQGAARLAKVVRTIFRRVQSDRDIVLVDQRGTGKSNPLDCYNEDDSLQALTQTSNRCSTK